MGNLLGVHLTVLLGATVPRPASPGVLESLESVEVSRRAKGRSGFQITFHVGRSGLRGMLDYRLLLLPALKPFSRVILVVTFTSKPRVLMDGIITRQELSPSNEPGGSTFTVTGEDVSFMMDREEKSEEHPAQSEMVIANKIIAGYARYGLIPKVIPPPTLDVPLPTERVPVQQGTDLEYLNQMADRFGYVFHVTPGPVPGTNTAYWGPPKRVGLPQKALSVNMGPETNVESIRFQHDALAPKFVSGEIQDRLTNRKAPVKTVASTRVPLASQPTWLAHRSKVRRTQFRQGGLNAMQALALAQGETDASVDDVVTGTGELDAVRYGDLLQPHGLVGLRGAGYQYDGLYYVKEVTHRLKRGEYKQSFTLTREGVGSLTPVVRP